MFLVLHVGIVNGSCVVDAAVALAVVFVAAVNVVVVSPVAIVNG